MSVIAGPGEAAPRPGIADLVEALRAAGFPVGVSEAIDATQLLLTLGERETDLGDPARLRSRLRPVFCKSREEQERFDAIFDDWWAAAPRRRTPPPPTSPPPPPPPPPPRQGLLPVLLIMLVLVAGGAAFLRYYDWPTMQTRQVPQPTGPTEPPRPSSTPTDRPSPRPDLAQGPAVDRLEPAFRFNVEIRPSWIWLVGVLPLVALLGVSVPALVLSRTRLRRRSEPMFLDPEPLAIEARRLVPPMPPELSDRLARHIRSRGIDIERLARRPQVDVRRTIEATLRNQGIPVLRYAVARIHPCYLLLVDVASERDPRGRLFFQWAERLVREGLDVEILLLRRRSDERSGTEALMVRPAGSIGQGERGWSRLSQVRAPRFGERLVVVSDGNPLVDEQGVWRRDALGAHFHRWRDRVLFTPVEPRDWGAREEAIERPESAADPGFIVLPLEESALGAWADLVVSGRLSAVALSDPQRFPGLLRQGGGARFVGAEPPDAETLERLILELRVYLGEIGFHWLAVVAIAPIVRWELTLLLGKAALVRLPRLGDDRSLSAALAANYRRLVRLPWLQRESMPDWLRLRLLAELSHARQHELRRVVEDLLEKISPRAVTDGIELGFERPPGSDVDRRDALRGPRDGHREGDPLYLGYMSGVSPEQLALRAPVRWASWARRMQLPRERGWHGWLSRFRQRVRAGWARWAWVDGLPYLGFSRWRAFTLLLLLSAGVAVLVAAGWARPPGPTPPGNVLFTDRAHPLVSAALGTSAAAWSPDGRRVVSGGRPGTLQIWDAQKGIPIGAPLQGHTGDVETVAWSPDGRRIASGGQDRTVRLWDTETGASIGPPLRHQAFVLGVAWSPDGQRLVSGSADRMLRIWDVHTGTAIGKPLVGDAQLMWAVAWSPDGRLIASGGGRNVRIWDANSGDPAIAALQGHTGQVRTVAWSPDGRRIVSGSTDGTLRVWSVGSGQVLGPALAGHMDAVLSVSWSPDGRRILSGSADRTLRLWDADTYVAVGVPLEGHSDSVWSVAWSPDGQRVMSADHRTLRFWNTDSATPVGTPLETLEQVVRMDWSPDGRRLVVIDRDGNLEIRDTLSGARAGITELQEGDASPNSPKPRGEFTTAAWSPDGRRMVTGTKEGAVSLWDSSTGLPISSFSQRHGGPVSSVAWSPDGRRIASGSNESTLRIWDADTGAPVGRPLEANTDWVHTVAWSPDGRRVAWGNDDGTVQILDVQAGAPLGRRLEGHTAVVLAVAWSPDGRIIASGGGDGTVRLWDVATGAQIGSALEASSPGMPAAETAVQDTRTKLARTESEARAQRAGLEPLKRERDPSGPEIELLNVQLVDPPAVQASASDPAGGKTGTHTLLVVGRVASRTPIKSFTINGVEQLANTTPTDTRFRAELTVRDARDHRVRLVALDTSKRRTSVELGVPAGSAKGTVFGVAWSPDGRRIIAASASGAVRLWDSTTRADLGTLRIRGSVDTIAVGPTAEYLAIATSAPPPPRAPQAQPSVQEAKRADAARQERTGRGGEAQRREAQAVEDARRRGKLAEEARQQGKGGDRPGPPSPRPQAESELPYLVQIWRLNPYPATAAPSGVSRIQALITQNVTFARARSQPFWWLLGLGLGGTLLAIMRGDRRSRRMLARRGVPA